MKKQLYEEILDGITAAIDNHDGDPTLGEIADATERAKQHLIRSLSRIADRSMPAVEKEVFAPAADPTADQPVSDPRQGHAFCHTSSANAAGPRTE